MGFWASMASAAGSALGGSFGSLGDLVTGGYFTRKGQSQQNRYNLYSTGTAHQREVKDLRMAGLNPVLSALGNGAAVLPVSGATSSPTDFSGVARSAVEHGLQAYNARTQRNLASQQQELLASQRENTQAQTEKSEAEAELTRAEADYVKKKTNESPLFGFSPFDHKYYNTNSANEPWQLKVLREGLWRGEGYGKRIGEALADWLNSLRNDIGTSSGGRNSAKSIQQERKYSNPRTIPEEKPSKAHPFLNRKGFGNW